MPSGLELCVLVASVTWPSVFTSAFFSPEREGRPVGVAVSLCSTRAFDDATGDGTASPGKIGDMTGALTGRAVLSGVDTIAEYRKLSEREKKECV